MKIISLYDGKCVLCQETKKIFEKLDTRNKVEWLSLQEYEKKNDGISFRPSELRKEIHIILPGNRVLKGFGAVRKLLLQYPATFIVGFLLYLPFISWVGSPIYKWIARNRHRFIKKKCTDGSCSL